MEKMDVLKCLKDIAVNSDSKKYIFHVNKIRVLGQYL